MMMVQLHEEHTETAAHPVRPALRGRHRRDGQARCNVCGALLAADHDANRCSCHRIPPKEQQWRPRIDPQAEAVVLAALRRAAPGLPVDLRYVLRTEDRVALHQIVKRLKAAGHPIEGCRPAGYRLMA